MSDIFYDYERLDDDRDDHMVPFYKTWTFNLGMVIILPILVYVMIIAPVLSLPDRVPIPVLQKYTTSELEWGLQDDGKISRVIFIGDVHGCLDQLKLLLDQVKLNEEADQVILLGDFISKGPDSIGVLDYAMLHNFTIVLGNHELNILSKYSHFNDLSFDDNDVFRLDQDPNNDKYDNELEIAKKLTPDHIKYLSSAPLFLDLGLVPLFDSKPTAVGDSPSEPSSSNYKLIKGIATHIGLSPPYQETDQNVMEWLDIEKSWYQDYNNYMKENVSKKDRKIVFYGHHSGVGLNLKKYTKGLDSGCVKGKQLSGLVIQSQVMKNGETGFSQSLVQIDCGSSSS